MSTEIFVSAALASAIVANPADAFVPFSYSAKTLKSTTEQSAPILVNAFELSEI